jgi:hypothetical protein
MFHQFVSFCIRLFRRNRLPELAAGAPSGSLRQQRCLGFKQAADSLGNLLRAFQAETLTAENFCLTGRIP